MNGDSERGRQWLGVPPESRVLVVVGGSLGATAINTVVRESLARLCEMYFVVHVCGAHLIDKSYDRPGYVQYEYVSDEWGGRARGGRPGDFEIRCERVVRIACIEKGQHSDTAIEARESRRSD